LLESFDAWEPNGCQVGQLNFASIVSNRKTVDQERIAAPIDCDRLLPQQKIIAPIAIDVTDKAYVRLGTK
jgi:hypothetical protein